MNMQIENFELYKRAWINKRDLTKSRKLTPQETKSLLEGGGLMVRNVYNWGKQEESSFWYLIKDHFEEIESLSSKVRNQIRKSLKCYDFRIVTHDEMMANGLELFNKSRERYGGGDLLLGKEEWKKKIGKPNMEFWMGFDKESGKPASFAINEVFDDYIDYSTMGLNPEFPNSTYPMYGLIFEMNKFYLDEKKVPFVCDGARSISGHSGIQSFLEDKFLFHKSYCDLQVAYKFPFGLIINILYPFRKLIKNSRVKALLTQEEFNAG